MTTKIVAEEWRPVVGFEVWYEVSNLGRVRRIVASRRSFAGRCLTPGTITGGYLSVTLCVDTTRTHKTIHRLVAEAFLPGRRAGEEVNHKNFDPSDNRAENLEWVSHAKNMRHSIVAGRHKGWGYANALLPTRKRINGGRFV